MKRVQFTSILAVMISIVVLLTASTDCSSATFSGKVVDEDGIPVPDVTVTINSYKGKFIPNRDQFNMKVPVFPPPQPTDTDATGAFSINNIVSPSVNKLKLFSEFQSDYEVRLIEMQGISFYIHHYTFNWHEGFAFGVEEESDITDVKITVRLRMKISGQVLDADGVPLSNKTVNLMVSSRSIGGGGSGRGGGTRQLDAEGKFTRYVNSPAYYTVTVTYEGQTVKSKEILLEEGQRIDGLTLKLKENPKQPKLQEEVKAQILKQPDIKRRQAAFDRRRKGVWAINPANRHAYKKIVCETPEEAIEKAKEQGAHLVSINDAAEQEWLLHVFGDANYWIGYTDDLKKDDKHWDNGDPLTHTNWDTENLITDSDKKTKKEQDKQRKFTVLIGVTGKWQRILNNSPVMKLTEKAILEKADLVIGIPTPDKSSE